MRKLTSYIMQYMKLKSNLLSLLLYKGCYPINRKPKLCNNNFRGKQEALLYPSNESEVNFFFFALKFSTVPFVHLKPIVSLSETHLFLNAIEHALLQA